MLKEIKKFNKGFTLIELLVVIAIIGILASIVLVSLGSARNRAYRASALSTISGIGSEIIICQDDIQTIAIPQANDIGGLAICTDASYATATGHTVAWPTLANTGGANQYKYSTASSSATGMAGHNAVLASPFYLYSPTNTYITCTFSQTQNLTCK